MKERPIPFGVPMARATLDGRKTQTRRIAADAEYGKSRACPYGVVGDRLWGREPWRVSKRYDVSPPRDITPRSCTVFYAAGGSRANHDALGWSDEPNGWPPQPKDWPDWVGRYRHARFMPRWASRITLEITGTRVERLQDISEADAKAEGLLRYGDGYRGAPDLPWCASPVGAYRELWESINGPESWAANPYVWVIEFKRLVDEARAAA